MVLRDSDRNAEGWSYRPPRVAKLSLTNLIPTKLKIGGITWLVKLVEPAEIDCDNQAIGDQSETTQLIRIASSLSPEMAKAVLLHEIIHCIDAQLDHDIVEMLANQLYQVLSENDLDFRGGGED